MARSRWWECLPKVHLNAIRIGDSIVMLVDEFPEMGSVGPLTLKGSPMNVHLYVEDADAVFKTALQAGATVKMSLQNMFWGDRYGILVDPFGHIWAIATHLEDLTPTHIYEKMKSDGCM